MFQITFKLSKIHIEDIDNYIYNFDAGNWIVVESPEDDVLYIKGYFNSKNEIEENYQKLKRHLVWLSATPVISELKNTEWQNEYKKHFKPWRINHMHWVPTWRKNDYFIPDNDKVIYLDPGTAFGMMDHPSTRLCIKILMNFYTLNKESLSAKNMIDVGCGSGILSLSATRLGFGKIYAFDNDPIAVAICHRNMLENDISGNLVIESQDLQDAIHGKKADLILANILSKFQIHHAQVLINAIKPQGVLGLSGILKNELQEVKNTFANIIKKNKLPYILEVDEIDKWTSIVVS